MSAMREPLIALEVWRYECLSCLHEWQESYEVWYVPDGHGGDAVGYRHDGQCSTSPWTELMCPVCHGCAVQTFPSRTTVVRRPLPRPQRVDDLDLLFRLRRLHAY
jgi:hypothetical protein